METKNTPNGAEKNVGFTIIVNAREKNFLEKVITFKQVVELEYDSYDENPDITYTITFSKGVDNASGSLTKGATVKIKNGMVFNVFRANRS